MPGSHATVKSEVPLSLDEFGIFLVSMAVMHLFLLPLGILLLAVGWLVVIHRGMTWPRARMALLMTALFLGLLFIQAAPYRVRVHHSVPHVAP